MSLTIDAHIDLPWQQTKHNWSGVGNGHLSSMYTAQGAKDGGLNVPIFALYLSDVWQDAHTTDQAKAEINRQISRLNSDPAIIKRTTLRACRAGSAFSPYFIALEGGRLIHNSLECLKDLAFNGIKYLTLTHNHNTEWADSATDTPFHGGLTPFGISVVKECEKLGVLVDVSHASDATAYDALSVSNRPVIASHSGCRKLVKHPRNLTDALIVEIAKSGGIICVPFAKRFIGHYSIADHIEHIGSLVGPDHIGIGSDIDGAQLVSNFTSLLQWREFIYTGLSDKGISDNDIDKVLGGNMERVLEYT